ncbi:uncharacterized protein [Prorops nasuta]|uniref:uncharacterized protein n=1 Tax=Prorops nasuta TaxID=863751 RepID=UPI0034CD745E
MEELLETCPYDPAHRIRRNRLQCHLMKCAKNFPNSTKEKCPFNQTHIIEKLELESHISECPDRGILELGKVKVEDEKPLGIVPIKPDLEFPSGEIWEDVPVKEKLPPMIKTESKPIFRQVICVPKSERKKFKLSERSRILKLEGSSFKEPVTVKPILKEKETQPTYTQIRLPKQVPVNKVPDEVLFQDGIQNLSIDDSESISLNNSFKIIDSNGQTIDQIAEASENGKPSELPEVLEASAVENSKTETEEVLYPANNEHVLKTYKEIYGKIQSLKLEEGAVSNETISALTAQMSIISTMAENISAGKEKLTIGLQEVIKENQLKTAEVKADVPSIQSKPNYAAAANSVGKASTGRGYMLKQALQKNGWLQTSRDSILNMSGIDPEASIRRNESTNNNSIIYSYVEDEDDLDGFNIVTRKNKTTKKQ